MKIVKPFTINLSVTESLIVISGLDMIIKDKERHELDKALAQKLKDKVLKLVKDNAIEKGGDIMANSYRYAEESDKARLEGLKVLNELMEKYKELNMQNTGFYTDLERLKETLTVEGD